MHICAFYLVNTSQGRHVHGLLLGHTSAADLGEVFPSSSLLDGGDEHFKRVFACEKVDDFEGMLDDGESVALLACVASVEHQSACESLHDGAEGLPELLALISIEVIVRLSTCQQCGARTPKPWWWPRRRSP